MVILFIGAMLLAFIEKGLLGSLKFYPANGNIYNFKVSLFVFPMISMFMGFVFGFLEEVS
jgi:hypothetical protein